MRVHGLRHLSALLFFSVLLVHFAVAFFIRNFGWDDGAITLAFARTFAETGRIALTGASVTVEGYSSTSWFLLMATVQRLFHPGFDAFIRTSQLLAGACAAGSAVLLFRLTADATRPLSWAVLSAAVFLSAPFINETMNGMEMTLLALAVLAFATVVRGDGSPSLAPCAAFSALIAATRFEAVVYLVVVAAAFLLSRQKRLALAIVGGAIAAFLLTELWRYLYFGHLTPNTVLAKRWEPYRTAGTEAFLRSRLDALQELFVPYVIPLFVTLFAVAARGRGFAGLYRSKAARLAVAYVLAVVVFNVAIGKNWGYVGRMELSAIPMLFFVLIEAARRAGVRSSAFLALVALSIVGNAIFYLQWPFVRVAMSPPREGRVNFDVTPTSFRGTGEAVDELRRMLGLERISFMVPDVGGSALCCDRINILDSGLLASPQLAVTGYAGFSGYLETERPDVVETHDPWSRVSNIYQSKFFMENYRPITFKGRTFHLRADRFLSLSAAGRVSAGVRTEDERRRCLAPSFDERYICEREEAAAVVTGLK